MKTFQKVSHVIFDLDGLLLDTESLYTTGIQNVADRYGKIYTWEMKCHLMGKPALVAATELANMLEIPLSPEELRDELNTEYMKILGGGKLLPGVEKLVDHLVKHDIPIAIATGSAEKTFNVKVANHEKFFNKFHHVVVSSDPEVKNGKPFPDIFLICASRFDEKPSPENVLVFEDAVNGVNAALSANMQVVMVPDKRMDRKLTEKATLVLSSIEQFQPELFGLPSYS